jgi:hypothetical protein
MKLVTFPEQIHWTETREFTILDDQGQEQPIRIIESTNGINVFTKKAGIWYQSDDTKLIDWIHNELESEELRLDLEQREEYQLKKEAEIDDRNSDK